LKKIPASPPTELSNSIKNASLYKQQKLPLWRIPLLAAAIFALLAAVWGGLLRMGWQLPPIQPSLIGAHGPLIIAGFFGTLIGIERAVALGARWPYIGPLFSALGGLLIIAGVPGPGPALLLTAGSIWLVLVFVEILRRHMTQYTLVMAAGALALAVGNIFWITGWPIHRIVLWWAAFLILTIAGERLELGRLARHSRFIQNLFTFAIVLILVGLLLSIYLPNVGVRLVSLGFLGLALWLLRNDIARKTIQKPGLPRFAAICLLSGYAWLAAAGLIGFYYGAVPAGFPYDAFLHALFLGFVFAMIFAHAPIIFPAILGIPIKFSKLHYLPLIFLHTSMFLRVVGNLTFQPELRMWGGMLNGLTILLFLILTIRSLVLALRDRAAQQVENQKLLKQI
jgi:hypothetical protein